MVVLFLKIRDEPDIVRLNLAHHLGWGFDHILIADNESTDETLDVLDVFRNSISVARTKNPHDWGSALYTLLQRCEERYGSAGWVAVSDPDEFWWTPEAPLASLVAAAPEHVVAVNSKQKLFLPTAIDPAVGPVYCRHTYRAHGKRSRLHTSYLGGKSLYRVAWIRRLVLTNAHWSRQVPHGLVSFRQPLVHHYMIDDETSFVDKVKSIERWNPRLRSAAGGEAKSRQMRLRDYKWAWWNIYLAEGDAGLRNYYRTKYLLSADQVADYINQGELVHDTEFATFKQFGC
jgi:hypothetical protein